MSARNVQFRLPARAVSARVPNKLLWLPSLGLSGPPRNQEDSQATTGRAIDGALSLTRLDFVDF
jgi:hypothetical protein